MNRVLIGLDEILLLNGEATLAAHDSTYGNWLRRAGEFANWPSWVQMVLAQTWQASLA